MPTLSHKQTTFYQETEVPEQDPKHKDLCSSKEDVRRKVQKDAFQYISTTMGIAVEFTIAKTDFKAFKTKTTFIIMV